MADSRRRHPSRRGPRITPPAWGCGEPSCPRYRWQPVSAMGEYDPVDVAVGDLEAHYARHHPDLAEEGDDVGHPLAA